MINLSKFELERIKVFNILPFTNLVIFCKSFNLSVAIATEIERKIHAHAHPLNRLLNIYLVRMSKYRADFYVRVFNTPVHLRVRIIVLSSKQACPILHLSFLYLWLSYTCAEKLAQSLTAEKSCTQNRHYHKYNRCKC